MALTRLESSYLLRLLLAYVLSQPIAPPVPASESGTQPTRRHHGESLFACAGAIGWIGILHYHLSAWWMLVPVIIIGSVYSYFYPQRQQ
jgi:hypothetical protein